MFNSQAGGRKQGVRKRQSQTTLDDPWQPALSPNDGDDVGLFSLSLSLSVSPLFSWDFFNVAKLEPAVMAIQARKRRPKGKRDKAGHHRR